MIEISVGRWDDNDVVVQRDAYIDYHHIKLFRDNDGTCYVINLSTWATTTVNGKQLTTNERTILKLTDILQIGQTIFEWKKHLLKEEVVEQPKKIITSSNPNMDSKDPKPKESIIYIPLHQTKSNLNVEYAGFWLRFAAFLIDLIIMFFVLGILGVIFRRFGSFFLGIIGNWLYYALMESSSMQATFGKMAVGLKVVDTQGNKINFGQASGRHFGKILSGMILFIGYMMAGWTDRKQALHDIISDCLVIIKK